MVSFAVQRFLVWCSSIYISFVSHSIKVESIKTSLKPMSRGLVPMFPLKYFMVSGFTLTSLIHFEWVFVCGVRQWSTSFFHTRLSSFPNTVEETFLSPLYVFHFFSHKSVVHICVGLFLGYQFSFIDPSICFSDSTVLFWCWIL